MSLHTRSLLVAAVRSATCLHSSVCRFNSTNEGTHEFAIHLWCDRVHIYALGRKKRTRILCAIDPCRLDLNLLETCCGEFAAIFVISERPRHTSDPQKHALA